MRVFLLLILWVSGSMTTPFFKSNLSETFSKPSSDASMQRNNGVCLFLSTMINAANWTPEYSRKFIQWMRKVFLVSVERQFKTPLPTIEIFKLFIRGSSEDPNLADLYHYGETSVEIPLVWHHSRAEWQVIVRETVFNYSCRWISSLWLDGDDAFLDGYFKYLTEEMPKILSETTTSEGRHWLGGVYALRSPKFLEMGMDRCRHNFWAPALSGGWSQGQGLILERSVWNRLDQKILYQPYHKSFVKDVREWVTRGLGQGDYVSTTGVAYYIDSDEIRSLDQKDAAESQIQMFDLSKNWTTSGLYVKTPFSSLFPWELLKKIPKCTKEHIIKLKRVFPQDIGFIIDAWIDNPEMHPTLLETCKNNLFRRKRLAKRNRTCEEAEARWLNDFNRT